MIKTFTRSRRLLIGGVLLLSGLIAGPLSVGRASAAYTVCYTDPVVVLSDGSVFTLQTSIQTDLSQVSSVDYYLHAPTGTSIVAISYDQFGSLENLHFSADLDQGSYKVDTDVTTVGSPVPVIATASLLNGPTKVRAGVSGQDLWMSF